MTFLSRYKAFYRDEEADEEDKVIYLTFDAGYSNESLERILEVLRRHNAHSAFFVLSHLVKSETELIRRMVEDGHLVCNHTARHPNMARLKSEEEFQKELKDLEELYAELIGEEIAPFYRPPEGSFSEQNLDWAEKLGYSTVFWSLAYADWDNNAQPDPEKSKQLLLNNTHNGMILLLHPTSHTNATILDALLSEWEAEGYRFGSLYELTKER